MKTKLKLILIVVGVLAVMALPVVAAPARPQVAVPGVEIIDLLFPLAFIQAGLGLVLAIVIDLGLGVAVAIQTRTFEWTKLADFYRTKVLGNVLGWALLDVLLRVGAHYQLPIVEQLQPIGAVGLYLPVAAALIAQIGQKWSRLRGSDATSS